MTNSNSLNLIIPAAGFGSRFRKAGYKVYKPFIPINNKFMIDYVMDPFPQNVKTFIIVNRDLLSDEQLKYLKDKDNTEIIEIEGHTKGPGYSIYCAADKLPLEESFFIAYSDIYWSWDFSKVKELLNYEGIIFTRRSFHPHLVNNNYSAFCLPESSNPNLLREIKEKGSYTPDWMEEPLSIGTFYVRNGHDMIKALETNIIQNNNVNNEFFPSLLFNELVKDNKKVFLHDVDFFVHWGIPEQLEDFINWNKVFNNREDEDESLPNPDVQNFCCMAGTGERMKKFSNVSKAFLKIGEYPMYEFVMKQFGCGTNNLLTVNSIAEQIVKSSRLNYNIINLGEQTSSQIDTLRKSYSFLKESKNIFVTSVDAYGIYDRNELLKFINKEQPDAIIFSFDPTLMQKKMSEHHTFISVKGNRVTDVHIKNRTSENDKGLAGFFWFSEGKIFELLDNVPEKNKGEIYIDNFLKYLVDSGKKIYAFHLEHYIHIGTVNEYLEFMFWQEYKSVI